MPFQYVSPLNKVSWDMSKQKECLSSLVNYLKDSNRAECHLVILQAIKVFT